MSVLDRALELYVKERIKEAPKQKLNSAINYRVTMFNELCEKAGFKDKLQIDIIEKVLLPFVSQIEKDLENWELERNET